MSFRSAILAPLIALLVGATVLLAQSSFSAPIPELRQRVTDLAGVFTASQVGYLEQKLAELETTKGSQIAVLLVKTTEGEAIESYSLRVVERNKIGRKGVDDGVLLLVATADRAVRIEVGYGLEGALTDAKAAQIIREIIIPRFRAGDFFGAVQSGADAIAAVVAGEPLPLPQREGSGGGPEGLIVPLFFFLLVLAQPVRSLFGRLPGGFLAFGALSIFGAVLGSLFLGIVFGLFAGALVAFGSALPAGYGGRSSRGGGWGGGSFGGGSISWGGGGGSFGGGGASGRW